MIPAVISAILLGGRVLMPGAAWIWVVPEAYSSSLHKGTARITIGALALLMGFLVNALVVMALGAASLYRPVFEAILLGGISAVGVIMGRRRHAAQYRRMIVAVWPAGLFAVVGFTLVLLLPNRGEWILGGWIPGVYVNEAAALVRTETFRPADPVFHEMLDTEEQAAFTRVLANRTERFPAVVVDAHRQTFDFQFFRLTPAAFGMIFRTGGFEALCKVNGLIAVLALWIFFGFMLAVLRPPHALFSTIALATQPIWIYHTHVPVSEMIHLVLVLGICFAAGHRTEHRFARQLLLLTLFAAVVNRFSFLPFAGLLTVFLAWDDRKRTDRRRVLVERSGQLVAILAGALTDLWIAPISIKGWSITPTLLTVFGGCVLVTFVLDATNLRERLVKMVDGLPAWTPYVLVGLAATGVLAVAWRVGRGYANDSDLDNVFRLVAYIGVLPCLLAVAGAGLLFGRKDTAPDRLRIFMLYLVAVTALLLIRKNIVDIYPWATRRHLAYTMPIVALLSGCTLGRLWSLNGPFRGASKALACTLLLVSILLNGPLIRGAWKYTEYNGISAEIEKAAAQIEPDDIVVADHPWWGTPLAMIHGRQALNGQHLHPGRDGWGESAQAAAAALKRLRSEGHTIKFLTSTDETISPYPFSTDDFELQWSSDTFQAKEVMHHSKNIDYKQRQREWTFRVYRMK